MNAWDRFDNHVSRAIEVMLGILVVLLLLVVIVGVAVYSLHFLSELS
tara:strand:- start:1777 stop:1917 length:141 start_codon:yes stop_codon:yes gene_type:complete